MMLSGVLPSLLLLLLAGAVHPYPWLDVASAAIERYGARPFVLYADVGATTLTTTVVERAKTLTSAEREALMKPLQLGQEPAVSVCQKLDCVVTTKEEVRAMVRSSKTANPTEAWGEVRKRYGARPFISLDAVRVAGDVAVVLISEIEGMLSGRHSLVVLRRYEGRWSATEVVVLAVS